MATPSEPQAPPAEPAELVTALQDQINAINRDFFDFVGVLQRDAPPVAVAGEAVLPGPGQAPPASAGWDATAATDRMARELTARVQAMQKLIDQLPHDLVQDENNHYARIAQLQQQDAEASRKLGAAVQAAEEQLLELQRAYALLAQHELQKRAAAAAAADVVAPSSVHT